MKKFLTILVSIAIMASAFIYTAPHIFADTTRNTVCASIGGITDQSGCNSPDPANSPTVYSLVTAIINILSWAVGILGVVMIIIGAGKYMTSGGDANAVASAKKTIIYALGGLVLAALSQALVHYVLLKATH